MKIKSYQSGGIVYLPTANRTEEAAATQAASSSSNSSTSKIPGFADKIIDMVRENGIDSDVNAFLKDVRLTLDLANDPTGQNLTMKEILSLARKASLVKTNYADYTKARESLESQDAWGEAAVDNHGDLYVKNEETKTIEVVDIPTYLKNTSKYSYLTNEDLLNERRKNEGLHYNNGILDDISKAVGMSTIVKDTLNLIKSLGKTEVTGYGVKQSNNIQAGIGEIVDAVLSGGNTIAGQIEAGADGIYKITQSSTHADTHLEEALSYLINAMPNSYKHTLKAKAAVEGMDPDAFLLEMLVGSTDRKLSVDFDNVSTENKLGKKTGTGGLTGDVQHTLAESYVDGQDLPGLPGLIEITPEGSSTSLAIYGQNAGPVLVDRSGNPGNKLPVASLPQLYEDAYGIRNVTSNTVCFGDQLIDEHQLGGLVYDGSDMYRVVLPFKVVNGGRDIVPDFELQKSLEDIINTAKNRGDDPATISRLLQNKCPGATYDQNTDSVVLPSNMTHTFLTFGAVAADNYVEFNGDSNYLVEDDLFDSKVYSEATKYGYANHKPNDPERLEGRAELNGWFKNSRTKGHLYKGNVFIPTTSAVAGTSIYNQERIAKDAYTNITGRGIESERQKQIRDDFANSRRETNWSNN